MTKEEARAIKKLRSIPTPVRSRFRLTTKNNKSIFPKKLRQTLVYVENFQLTTPTLASTPAGRIFRFNGLFDPRYDIGGHQPYGFDQLMAIYKRYTCVGAKMTVTFTCVEGDVYYDAIGGINISSAAALPSTVDQACESQYSSYVLFTQNSSPGTAKVGMDMANYFGDKDCMDDPHLSGSVSSDPIKPVYAAVWVTSDTAAKIVHATVKIEYDTVFTEPLEVISS